MMPGGGGGSNTYPTGYPAVLTKDDRIVSESVGSASHRFRMCFDGYTSGNISASNVHSYLSTARYFVPLLNYKVMNGQQVLATLNAGQEYYIKSVSGTSSGKSYYFIRIYDANNQVICTSNSTLQNNSSAGTDGSFVAAVFHDD